MRTKKLFIQSVAIASSLVFSANVCFGGGWVDDWVAQKTESGPAYFKGQKRGYYSGGTFNARWPSHTDNPVTVEMPRIKSGCGGIDVFMGGVSFLDFDRLVKKLQNIMMNAGAIAFDLALGVLSEKLSGSIKAFEALENNLNGMQINDCMASKKLVAKLQTFAADPEGEGEKLGEAISAFKLGQGESTLWTDTKDSQKAASGVPQPTDTQNILSGCNDDLKQLIGDQGLVLENVGVGQLGFDPQYVALIRGFIGDIEIQSSVKAYYATYVSPCSGNGDRQLDALNQNEAWIKKTDETCVQLPDANANLQGFVAQKMNKILTAMQSKSVALDTTDVAFIDNSPLSIALVLKNAIMTGREEAVIADMSALTARAYALAMLTDLYSRLSFMIYTSTEILAKKGVAKTGSDPETCQSAVFSGDLNNHLTQMAHQVEKLQIRMMADYQKSLSEYNATQAFLAVIQKADEQVTQHLGSQYGPSLARRAMQH